MTRLHDDELPVDAGLVRTLLERSFPDLAALPVRAVDDPGSSNSLFRLGDALAVRLPRQPGGGATIRKEAAWLPQVAACVTAEVPRLVGLGAPGHGYDETWAVTSWLAGEVPRARLAGEESVALAHDLGRFVTELRSMPVPAGAVDEPALATYRGDPLPDLDADFRETVDACRGLGLGLDLDEALRLWDAAVAAASTLAPMRAWYHGDLLAENVLLDGHRLTAVLDLGGLGLGDPTVDLVVAWNLLDAAGRDVLRRSLDVDDAAWTASRGWALLLALIVQPYYGATMPRRCAARLGLARAALAGP
jgi:aminoglycoside phosphotransferase (APT) family kinase protein